MARFGANFYQGGRSVGTAQKMRKEAERAREEIRGPSPMASQSQAAIFSRSNRQEQQPQSAAQLTPVQKPQGSPLLGGTPAQGSMQQQQTGGQMQMQTPAQPQQTPIFGGGQSPGGAFGGLGGFQAGGDYVPPPNVQQTPISSVGQLTGAMAGMQPIGGGITGLSDATPTDPVTAAIIETIANGEMQSTQDPYSSVESGTSDLLMKLLMELEGGVDTSAEEALIAQLTDQRLGQAGVDMAAGFGGAGFGGGAMAAAQGDLQRQAAMDEAQQILGVRSDARDSQLDRLKTALGFGLSERGMDLQEEAFSKNSDVLDQLLGYLTDENGAVPEGGEIVTKGYKPGLLGNIGTFGQAIYTSLLGGEVVNDPALLPDDAKYVGMEVHNSGFFWKYQDSSGHTYYLYVDGEKSKAMGGFDEAGEFFAPGGGSTADAEGEE